MVTYAQAFEIATVYLKGLKTNVDPAYLAIVEGKIREEEFGWIFGFNDKRFIETGDARWALMGNSPIVVLRRSRMVFRLRWLRSWQASIDAFKANLDENGLPRTGKTGRLQ